MPSVEYSTPELQGLLGGDLSVSELENIIPMLGVDMESIDDKKLVVEVFPNRPDMLSIEGFVRALRGFIGRETGFSDYPVGDSDIVLYVESSVADVRPYVSAAAVEDVTLTEEHLISLMNVQEKLHMTHGVKRRKVAIGVHDSGQLKPPYTYKAVKPDSLSFVPLDMAEPMTPAKILSKHPKGRDYAHILEGLKKYPIIVDSENQVLSFPPIINGELTRLTDDTKNIFIECTGLSQLACDQAVNIVVSAIADRGGRILSVELKRK